MSSSLIYFSIHLTIITYLFGYRYLYIVRVPNNSMENNKIICPKCKKDSIVKRGSFHTKAHGKQQRYFCKSCNKKFIPQSPFYRMRNHPKKITLCLDLFYKGVSTREIQSHLQAFYPHNSDHSNIYRWIKKYSLIMSKYTDKLKIKASREIQIDEMEFHRRKSHKAKLGIDKNWFVDVIDTRTKFLVSAEYFKTREQKQLIKVLRLAKVKTQNQVRVVTSDGLLAYPKAIKKTFGYNNKKGKSSLFSLYWILGKNDSTRKRCMGRYIR